jgi:hypothetical protein
MTIVNFYSNFSPHELTSFSSTAGLFIRSSYRRVAHILSGSIYFSWLNEGSVNYDDKCLRLFLSAYLLRKAQENMITNETCNHYFICRC